MCVCLSVNIVSELAELNHSDGILEGKSDFKNLSIMGFDLFLEFIQLLILLLSAGLVLVLAMGGQLVNLERIVEVLRNFPFPLEALDLAGADLEAIGSHTYLLLSCCCLHFTCRCVSFYLRKN